MLKTKDYYTIFKYGLFWGHQKYCFVLCLKAMWKWFPQEHIPTQQWNPILERLVILVRGNLEFIPFVQNLMIGLKIMWVNAFRKKNNIRIIGWDLSTCYCLASSLISPMIQMIVVNVESYSSLSKYALMLLRVILLSSANQQKRKCILKLLKSILGYSILEIVAALVTLQETLKLMAAE